MAVCSEPGNPEYDTLVTINHTVSNSLSSDPLSIAQRLLAEGLISDITYSAVLHNATKTNQDKAAQLVEEVIKGVKHFPHNFERFLEIIEDFVWLNDLTKLIRNNHRKHQQASKVKGNKHESRSRPRGDNWSEENQAFQLVERESLEQSELEECFTNISDRTFELIEASHVSVDMFKARLSSLHVRNKQQHRDFLSSLTKDVNPTVGDIWFKLNLYNNFLNYSLLESVIKKFGDKELMKYFLEFKRLVKVFRRKTFLCNFTESLREMSDSLSEEHLRVIVAKLDKPWERCTLEDIENSKEVMARKLFLPTYFFRMKDIKEGCVSVSWLLPAAITALLKMNLTRADIKYFCKLQGILEISFEDFKMVFSKDDVITKADAAETDAIQREVSLLEDKFAEIEEALFVEMYMSKRDITTSDSYQMILNKIQDGAWLSTCWSFHDCCLFEKLVDNFGSDDLKKRAKNYSYEITEFCRNTVLSDFAIFSIAVGRNLPEKEFKDFIIELGRCEKFTLEELYKLVETINVGFSLPMHTLILKNVSPESDGLTVTWAIHAALVTSEKRSWTWSACTRSLYKRHHIKSIIIDDYRISRHQNPSYSKYRSASRPTVKNVVYKDSTIKLKLILFCIVLIIPVIAIIYYMYTHI